MLNTQVDAFSEEIPDLMSYLETKYRDEQPRENDVVDFEAGDFLEWAKKHLTQHRPTEIFAVDNNYGIVLTKGQRVKLCPGVPGEPQRTGGDMANPDASISVTRLS